nr:unnamed protein product [Digitaria exilis]
MESIIARALEYTLKYWLKSFSRDQFKLQGRTAQLSNLDINGDALHASLGLPPALTVDTARVGKLQITLPSVSNVQVEPIEVNIDKLDLVLVEKDDSENLSPSSTTSSPSATKSSGYGYADKVVNLKEARDFSNNKGFIYVFKKLEWQSLSVDLLPHPDMFTDARFNSSSSQDNKRDDDGAKRMFFGGERFLEGISGEANITVQRTEQNNPLGLEVQLHITEAVCPALSEPGLRAFLRFMTGVSVCLNRGDVDPKAQQVTLQEQSCLRIASFLADGVMPNGSTVLRDPSINSLSFSLKEFDLSVPLDSEEITSLNVSAKVSGVRLGGGMTYTESLLHRFGILGPDGGPGEGLLRGLKDLSSGPLAKLFKSSHLTEEENERSNVDDHNLKFDLGVPDDLDVFQSGISFGL